MNIIAKFLLKLRCFIFLKWLDVFALIELFYVIRCIIDFGTRVYFGTLLKCFIVVRVTHCVYRVTNH